jgi:DNA polymerase I-like protein with 3'-5' exonuclease and polymerase domains
MAPRLAVPVVRSAEQVEHILSNYQGGIGLDLEWGNDGKISIFGFAWNNGRRAGAFSRTEQTGETVRRILERVTTDTTKGAFLVTHNGTSADLPKLQEEGIILGTRLRNASSASSEESAGGVFDTMLGLHATHAHLAGTGSYDLRSLVLLYGHSGRDSGNWFPLDWKRYDEDIWETCALDAAAALYCAKPLREAIERDGLGETSAISHRVAPIFERMGRRGVRLDMQVLEQIHKHRELERERLIASLPTITKRKEYKRREPREWTEPVNPRSDAVIGYFESTWGYTLRGRTRADFQRASADSRCPAEARKVAEICAALSQAGSDTTWIGDTEDDGLTFSKVKDGFVFPQYNVVGTPDRPSCTGTNIQNFPRPGEDPRPVPLRAAVIPPESGMVLISVDYQAVETYTNAVEAGDWEMVKAIQEGRRGHQQTADFINTTFGLALTRQQGKTVNHSLDKGESAGNLAVRLWGNRTRANLGRAQGILDALLQPYPATQAFRAQLRKGAGENNPLVVVNRFGRRLMCFARSKYAAGEEQEYGRNREEQAARERWKGALAFLGRSCAVDCLLRVMSKVFEEARLDAFSLPYIEIHDELVYAVPKEGAARCAGILKETFEEPIPELDNLSIPCEVKVAGNWADCK